MSNPVATAALTTMAQDAKEVAIFENTPNELRVSDLLCMSNLAHASKLKEHDDNDDIQGSIRRAAERR
jgi:hypothetical protein